MFIQSLKSVPLIKLQASFSLLTQLFNTNKKILRQKKEERKKRTRKKKGKKRGRKKREENKNIGENVRSNEREEKSY